MKFYRKIVTLIALCVCTWTMAKEVVTVLICDNDEPFLYGCKVYDHSGEYDISEGGVERTLSLTYGSSRFTPLVDTAQVGTDYVFGAHIIPLTEIGDTTFVDSLNTVVGCDSVVQLDLHVVPIAPRETSTRDTLCHLSDYVHRLGIMRELKGDTTFTDTVKNAIQLSSKYYVDSLYHYALRVTGAVIDMPQEDTTLCFGERVVWHEQVCDTSGMYFDTVRYVGTLCDSAHYRLRVTVLPDVIDFQQEDTTLCFGEYVVWHEQVCDSTGMYYDTVRSVLTSCDSIRYSLQLTILPAAIDFQQEDTTLCFGESVIWHDQICDQSKTYYDTIRYAGMTCDSARYSLQVTILADAIDMPQEDTTLCFGESVIWHNHICDTSGMYFDTVRYVGTLCDSARYRLRVTVLPNVIDFQQEDTTLCFGEHVVWHDQVCDSTGMYYDTVRSVLTSCDSIRYSLQLTILPAAIDFQQEDTTLCFGERVIWHEQICDQSKTYYDTIRYAGMTCDSARYSLRVTILADAIDMPQEDTTLCFGERVVWHDHICDTSGMYFDTIRYAGTLCDSARYSLQVTILADAIDMPQEDTTLCFGESVVWHEQVCDASGMYFDTVRYAGTLCDSARYSLQVTILPDVQEVISDTVICVKDTFVWRGQMVKETKTYTDTVRNRLNCDSIRYTLHAVVNLPSEGHNEQTICRSELPYEWESIRWTEAGVKTRVLTNAVGCDSVVTLTLTVLNTSFTEVGDTLCLTDARSKYPQFTIEQSGIYYDTLVNAVGCDSVVGYTIILLSLPELPELAWIAPDHQPVTACGYAIRTDSTASAVATFLGEHAKATTATITDFWFEKQLPIEATFTPIDTARLQNLADPVLIRLVAVTECQDTLYGNAEAYEVVKPTPEQITELGTMPAVSKYNNWLLMIDNNLITEMGYTIVPDDVKWLLVIGDIDPIGIQGDDQLVGVGFYYTADKSLDGRYYALIEAQQTQSLECGATLRTALIQCTADRQMRLAPSVIRPGETMGLIHLNPEVTTHLRMYDSNGKLVQVLESEGAEQVLIQPEQGMGVYLLRVISGDDSQSFKYVITQ